MMLPFSPVNISKPQRNATVCFQNLNSHPLLHATDFFFPKLKVYSDVFKNLQEKNYLRCFSIVSFVTVC